MKLLRFGVFGILAAGLAVAGPRYNVTLHQASTVNGTQLKPGDYKIEVNGDKATITSGKTSVEAPVKVEDGDEKYKATTVRYATGNGSYQVDEIRLGGTKTKLVFDSGSKSATR
jgi:hypothetical protein